MKGFEDPQSDGGYSIYKPEALCRLVIKETKALAKTVTGAETCHVKVTKKVMSREAVAIRYDYSFHSTSVMYVWKRKWTETDRQEASPADLNIV